MSANNSFSHLTLEERRIILTGITNGSSKTAIAQTIGKDKSTVGKEIKLHRSLTHKCKVPLECNNYRKCPYGRRCTPDCPEYNPFKCSRKDRTPGACNGCSNWSKCRFDKYTYSPEDAQMDYRSVLVDSRQGVNLTTSEAKAIADIVSRKMSKKKSKGYKKRVDKKYLQGRTYKDYKLYINENSNVFVTQMDTVYNDEINGPFIQTFKFINACLIFAILHNSKTAESMKQGVDLLESILGTEVFQKYVHILLTDRGAEFSAADAIETGADGTRRTRVFYCDPMQSGQKGSLENKHIELRYILPKGTNLYASGLTDQDSLNTVLSHVNSAPVEKLGGKSPLDVAEFMYHDLFEKFETFGLHKIEKDKVVLNLIFSKNNLHRWLSGLTSYPFTKWNLVLHPTKCSPKVRLFAMQ